MVQVNDVSVREAKQARDTHRYKYFEHKIPLPATSLTFRGIKQATVDHKNKIICSCDYDMTTRGER